MSLLQRMERTRNAANSSLEYRVLETVETVDIVQREVPNRPKDTTSGSSILLAQIKAKAHVQLVDDLTQREDHVELSQLFENFLMKEQVVLTKTDQDTLLDELTAEISGYGPIDGLLRDDSVSEIMVVAHDLVYVERQGKIEETQAQFKDDEHVMRIIEKIVSPIGRRIDEATPYVDARLPDGSRVHAIIPPLALKGPCLTIRKFASTPLEVTDLISKGTLTPAMAEFLKSAITARVNIVISGGTGSGKTTTLNVLSSFIGEDERILTIEDAAELRLRQKHLVALETRPANVEGKGTVTIRDLVKNALRMRPDRIVVGEVRGSEALDMLQAMNTGHDGSLTTGHANSPRDMVRRLETMVMMAGMELPSRAIREQIASAVQLIVHQARMPDGKRRITHITEVLGMEGEQITLQDVFVFEQTGRGPDGIVLGRHRPSGVVPHCVERMKEQGAPMVMAWFRDEKSLVHGGDFE